MANKSAPKALKGRYVEVGEVHVSFTYVPVTTIPLLRPSPFLFPSSPLTSSLLPGPMSSVSKGEGPGADHTSGGEGHPLLF